MLLSDKLWFFHKTIIALSGGHFEYFFAVSENIYTCLGARGGIIFFASNNKLNGRRTQLAVASGSCYL